MSPHIDLTVNSVAMDEQNLIVYINMSQVFRIWLLPFYAAPVNLTSVVRLTQHKPSKKYYIISQNDLYQVNEWIKFVWFGGAPIAWLWQILATFLSLLGAVLLFPISLIEERYATQGIGQTMTNGYLESSSRGKHQVDEHELSRGSM